LERCEQRQIMGNQVTYRHVSHDEVSDVGGGHLTIDKSNAKLFGLRQKSKVQ